MSATSWTKREPSSGYAPPAGRSARTFDKWRWVRGIRVRYNRARCLAPVRRNLEIKPRLSRFLGHLFGNAFSNSNRGPLDAVQKLLPGVTVRSWLGRRQEDESWQADDCIRFVCIRAESSF